MKVYLGIDHGLKGALATITSDGKIHKILPMPLYKIGNDEVIDCFQIYSWLYENYGDYEHELIAVGERLHAIFKASASTTFNFGKNVGKVVGIIECLKMDYMEVRAVDWQKHMFTLHSIPEIYETKTNKKTGQIITTLSASGKPKRDTKAMAKVCASKIWEMEIFDYILNDGVLDALLIAEHARLTHGSK
jgi:hypothetical protein